MCTAVSRTSTSSGQQLAEPSDTPAQRTEATATLGGLAFDQTTARTCNSLRISTKPEFPNQRFYNRTLTTGCNPDPIPNVGRFTIVECDGHEENIHGSRRNQREADKVGMCVNLLIGEYGVSPSEIGVAAAYSEQKKHLQHVISQLSLDGVHEVKVDSFDGFQGSERDVMVLSFTRSNEDNNIGFLAGSNGARRLNVALTRAKRACYLVGDWNTLRQSPETDLYDDLYEYVNSL
uniref:DEAD/DEAH box helicase n=1 Tax=Haloprofundus sp. MHR1 TaxID=2572921 RepID=UPI001F18C278|nr:C-terminal helicase domain-containing protein [Haloprofundus sp. MHR1]